MSYKTQISLKIYLGKNTPEDLVEWFRNTIENKPRTKYNESMFFETERWGSMFSTLGYDNYKKPYIREIKKGWELVVNTDINYESGEIYTFIEWIRPYVFGRKKKVYLGWYRRADSFKRINVYLLR